MTTGECSIFLSLPFGVGVGRGINFYSLNTIVWAFLRVIAVPSDIPVTRPLLNLKTFLGAKVQWVSFPYYDFSDIKERDEVISSCNMNQLKQI